MFFDHTTIPEITDGYRQLVKDARDFIAYLEPLLKDRDQPLDEDAHHLACERVLLNIPSLLIGLEDQLAEHPHHRELLAIRAGARSILNLANHAYPIKTLRRRRDHTDLHNAISLVIDTYTLYAALHPNTHPSATPDDPARTDPKQPSATVQNPVTHAAVP